MPKDAPKPKKGDVATETLAEILHVTGLPMESGVLEALLARQAAAGAAGGKNPAAVMLGRKGGLKGGPARMAGLSAEARKKLASLAAKKRWREVNLLKEHEVTPEEARIFHLFKAGKTTADIAATLGVSATTIAARKRQFPAELRKLISEKR